MVSVLIILTILAFVIALVAWSLHLMQLAFVHQEFSLMLAGCLVAIAAAGVMGVYCLMGDYVGYVTQLAQRPCLSDSPFEIWVVESDELAGTWSNSPIHEFESLQTPQTVATFNP